MIKSTGINGLLILEPQVFQDERGYFFESWNLEKLAKEKLSYQWVQDNEAFSTYGAIRGMHYQNGQHAQAKLVRVISGEVLDVVIDLRRKEPTFGKMFSIILSGQNKKQLLVPRGFAHGYGVLSKEAIFAYKCDNQYSKANEEGIHPLDPDLNIDWMIPEDQMIISDKDKVLPYLKKQQNLF